MGNRKLLIVVDYQKDFVDGALGIKGAENLEQEIYDLVLDPSFNEVIFTYDTHQENYLETQEGINLPTKHCIEKTKGHELYGIVEKAHIERTSMTPESVWNIKKPTFGSRNLLLLLMGLKQYDEIHIVGLTTNVCVISNAVIAKTAQPEAKIVIHKNLVASFDPILHEKALDVMASLQMEIR